MDRANFGIVALGGLIVGPIFLHSSFKSSIALERPVHSAIILLVAVASILLLSARTLGRYYDRPPHSYSSLPLNHVDKHRRRRSSSASSSSSSSPPPSPSELSPTTPTSPRLPDSQRTVPPSSTRLILLIALTVAMCIRVEITRRIIRNIECPGNTHVALIPFFFAAYDYWTIQRHIAWQRPAEDVHESIYDAGERHWYASNFRWLVPCALLAFCSILLQNIQSSPASTYICAAATFGRQSAATSRLLAPFVDFSILLCIHHIFQSSPATRKTWPRKSFELIAFAGLAAALVYIFVGLGYYIFSPDDRRWIVSSPPGYSSSLIKLSLLSSVTTLCLIISTYLYAPIMSTAIVVFTVTICTALGSAWTDKMPFPPRSERGAMLLFGLTMFTFTLLCSTRAKADNSAHGTRAPFPRISSWLHGLILILVLLRGISWLSHTSNASFHPVDSLIFEAKTRHQQYAEDAASSTTLGAAVEKYKTRYHRQPPPRFDKWFEYATARESKVIDEFDRINQDLAPFWAFSPAEIRHRTWEAIANSWHDIAGISIRNGTAEISPNVMPTHRWMLDGVNEMINHFGEWLPDMDLGFNVNDECRVAIPYEAMEKLLTTGKTSATTEGAVFNDFSDGRASTWQGLPAESTQDRHFTEMSFQQTFHEFGNVGCPPDSAARNQRYQDLGHLCVACAAPHSLGAFMANWTRSADICHQPDIANLHGINLSPASYKATHELYPIFSQSKAGGYNDIVYPSPWNYMDKVKYEPNEEHPDPAFGEKNATLFWRGATSEGVSSGAGAWQGMSRQRFVHLANGINNTTPPQALLLPYPIAPSKDKLAYTMVPIAQLTKLVPADVHIVDSIARCGGKDCDEQGREFAPLVAPSDFQAHWAYKYLLDLDGAGFSGRFLSFMSSRSLPFKAALFREWYDSRLEPWYHFVPLDLRGHGFWATLVYFAGVEGVIDGKSVSVPPHDRQAELIAEEGRKWAGQVLRKEDMEIYLFRLLLEWGRLTDDRREELGFSIA